jgi:tetratricopeptide (TPR) repeat protein
VDLDKAIGLVDRPYLRFLRGTVLCKLGRHADALPDLDHAIAAQPANSQFYRVRAIARVGAGLPERALEDGEWMIAHASQKAEAHYARGVALAGLNRSREAVADFDEVVRLQPEWIYPLRARAEVFERLGEPARAEADRAEFTRRSQGQGGCRGCGVCVDPLHP